MSFNSYGFPYNPDPSHPFREPRPKSKFGFHGGEDRPAPAGTPVPAQFDGTVFRSGPTNGYGNAVVVESIAPNGRKFYTLYGHLGPDGLPAVGTDVKAGESLLGNVGTEAFVNSFPGADIKGTHLHWEIISDKAGLNQNGSLGIVSSDTTHRGNPDTFDINNPFFPYEGEVPLPRQRPDLGDRQRSDQKTQPPDSSTNFNDRFSGINAASRAGSSGFGGPTIPFLPRASGSLVGPDRSSSLFVPAPMSPAEPVPFGGGFVPGPLSSRPLYRTGSWHVSFGPAPADAVAPNASSFGDAAQPVPPSQLEGAPLRDARQERYLGRFTYDPAQGSPFAKPPVAAQPSPDGSLSLNDA